MNDKKKSLWIIGIVVSIFVVLALLSSIRFPMKKLSEDTIGNTAGNLNNGGLFCEYDGKVYFSNAYDNGTLYVMNSDETEVKKLNDSNVSFINASESYLIYYQSGTFSEKGIGSAIQNYGIYRSNLKGKGIETLDRCICTALVLSGNHIYYQHYDNKEYTKLYKADIAGHKTEKISDDIINPHCVSNGSLYFNGTGKNHHLYALNTVNDSIATIWSGNIWNPIVEGNYVYYMDLENDYGLSRYSMSNHEIEILTHKRVENFNIYGNMIYYQTISKDNPELRRMRTDGSNDELVWEGTYENIHITSNYVYFNAYGSKTPVYHTSTYGSVNVSVFQPSIDK